MLRSLTTDLLELIVPLAVGALLFALGAGCHRWPRWMRVALIGLAVGVVAVWASTLAKIDIAALRPIFSWLGGAKIALSWSALLLLGVAWGSPRRSFTPHFLVFLAGVSGLLITIEGSASLWWRWLDPNAWTNTVDQNGLVTQSSGKTCGPSSAVLFLHHYGIAASEGEMAYLARTSWFGSDCYDLSRAVQAKAGGWVVHYGKPGYDALAQTNTPFIAEVRRPGVGYHAIFVESTRPEETIILDPANGVRIPLTRAEFEAEWDGTAIWMTRETK